MKKIIAWLLVLALTAAVSIGATLAYLTDTDEDVNVMTLGKVKIDQLEYERVDVESKDDKAEIQEFHDNKPLLPVVTKDGFTYTPGDTYVDWEQIGKDGYTSPIWNPDQINNEVDKMVFVKNKGDYDAYVRSVFAFEAGKYTTLEEFQKMVHLNLNTTDYTWEWSETPVAIPNEDGSATTNYFIATATYNKVLAPGALTEISLSQIALDSSATNADVEAFGDTYQVLVKSQGIQADGFTDAATALTEGFGAVDATKLWENDAPTKGIDLRTALHYYQGNKSNAITGKVTNIYYALNKEYPQIIDTYDGTLVDVEQDVPVYAYYVPNGTNYDIYCLADSKIYSPKDSSGLYKNMRALKYVDTHNYDVSRVETMYELFRYGHSLTEVDVSHWDVSNVTNMFSVFDECRVLSKVDVSNWNTGKVEEMSYMFYQCYALKTLDVSDWNVSNVKKMRSMFYFCTGLQTLEGIENWNTSSAEDMSYTFSGCNSMTELNIGSWNTSNVTTFEGFLCSRYSNSGDMKFTALDIGGWDVSSVTNFKWMFYGCGYLTELDLSDWDVSNATSMYHMFADCFQMTDYDFTGWNTAKVTDVNGMFNSNRALQSVDLSDFDVQNIVTFAQFFDGCTALEEVIGLDQWNTASMQKMGEMFNGCASLRTLDLSAFDTSKLIQTDRTFYNCSSLTTIYVGDGWNMSNVTTHPNMFTGCSSIVGGNGTVYSTANTGVAYACVDTVEHPGYLTYKAPATTNP